MLIGKPFGARQDIIYSVYVAYMPGYSLTYLTGVASVIVYS